MKAARIAVYVALSVACVAAQGICWLIKKIGPACDIDDYQENG